MDTQNIKNAGIELTNSQYYYKKKIIYNMVTIFFCLVLLFVISAKFNSDDDFKYKERNTYLVLGITILVVTINTLVFDHKTFKSIKKAGDFLMEVD